MRHRNRVRKLGLAADQRKALLRSLVTQLFLHEEIITTVPRAKALVSEASRVVTWAKRGDLAAVRLASRILYRVETGKTFDSKNGKPMPETVLRKVFAEMGARYQERQGGYVRVLKLGRRRGDNTQMALVQLV
jgi:large subunit ribosomal protein L17